MREITTNVSFDALCDHLVKLGDEAKIRASETPEYKHFISQFPLDKLLTVSLDRYCIGKQDKETFSNWIERKLQYVLGRYMPGTAAGHLIYFDKSGDLYKHGKLEDLPDQDALDYVLKISHMIASANPHTDTDWLDDNERIFEKAGLEPRTVGSEGRKLRLLSIYHPDDFIPISSPLHLRHFLSKLGCTDSDIPPNGKTVATSELLYQYYLRACERVAGLTTNAFMWALYGDELGLKPEKTEYAAKGISTYLLTWNPKHFDINASNGLRLNEDVRWSCVSKKPKVGDKVYLMRIDMAPKGIIASGTVTQASHMAEHYSEPEKSIPYIRFNVDELRTDCASGLLPEVLLKRAFPEQNWNPQGSGISIDAKSTDLLEEIWQAGDGIHSLKQFVEWTQNAGKEYSKNWLPRYQATIATAEAIKKGEQPIDSDWIELQWRNPDNGVSSIKPSILPQAEYLSNLDRLKEYSERIFTDSGTDCYRSINDDWKAQVEAGRFSKHFRAIINRAFSAVDPARYTSLLQPDDCKLVLSKLGAEFQLPSNMSDDWPSLNQSLKNALEKAQVDPSQAVESNIALWRLLESYEKNETPLIENPESKADDDEEIVAMKNELNLILYGPPGTGKTYNTINEALNILEPGVFTAASIRKEMLDAFNRYKASGQIEFCTFHQSFSYEDFVEGIQAVSENGQLSYPVKEGIFRKICNSARTKVTASVASNIDLTGKTVWKMSLGNTLGSDAYIYEECIKNGYALLGYGDDIDFSTCKNKHDIHKLFVEAGQDIGPNSYPVKAVAFFLLEMKPGDLVVVTDGNTKYRAIGEITGNYRFIDRTDPENDYSQCRDVNWLRVYSPSVPSEQLMNNIFSQASIYRLRDGSIDYKKLTAILNSKDVAAENEKRPYVFIIDEINRGNISRIFGELITLIEPSKRAGAQEEVSVMLPYSKKEFSVPDNVHIIGTMNTADRSLSGLDIALRRRFTFKEMPPVPEYLDEIIIEGINLGKLLRILNDRIEVLLDRDRCLGHAYFIPLSGGTMTDLAFIFRQQIFPLLQEYFFEDWERIAWVLNDLNKPKDLQFLQKPVTDLSALFGADTANRVQDRRWRINETAFDRPESYLGIMEAGK